VRRLENCLTCIKRLCKFPMYSCHVPLPLAVFLFLLVGLLAYFLGVSRGVGECRSSHPAAVASDPEPTPSPPVRARFVRHARALTRLNFELGCWARGGRELRVDALRRLEEDFGGELEQQTQVASDLFAQCYARGVEGMSRALSRALGDSVPSELVSAATREAYRELPAVESTATPLGMPDALLEAEAALRARVATSQAS